ncbi:MAG TPA: GNAT family N-acetyltransferase [Anaerolineae bacterium]|nr:GNAT family N-acetyltransferase [Anaerolineae bacterium]
MATDGLVIRSLSTAADFRMCELLQQQVWGMDDLMTVPAHVLITAAKNGGLVLGAFVGRQMVGFVFGFPGLTSASEAPNAARQPRLKHCSHMVGVLPEYQGQGIGYRLKLAQRERVRAQGIDLITWTYDPLEARNAALNFGKLGVTCRTYLRNIYGELGDELNRGLPSDRFQVDWEIVSERAQARITGAQRPGRLPAGAQRLNHPSRRENGLLVPSDQWQLPSAPLVLVRIPSAFQAIKHADMGLARAWRQHTRMIFETAFAAGYMAEEFLRSRSWQGYLLRIT